MMKHRYQRPEAPRRVVILGARGFIGGAIHARLAAEGVSTVPLGRADLDLTAADAAGRLKSILQPADVLVVVSAVAPAKTVPMLIGNLHLLEPVCEAISGLALSQIVYVSSDAVYADDSNPVTENSYVAPSTIHGMMHSAREMMLRSSTAVPLAILRPTLAYGPDDPHNGYGPNRFRRQAEKGEPISVFGEGEEQRDHVFVGDVAGIAWLSIAHRSEGIINVATGRSISFRQVADMVAAQYDGRARVVSIPRPGPIPHLLHRFFDITGCYKSFPQFSFTPLKAGLKLSMQGTAGKWGK
jgi:nucleoside-diphosphate-sugar epimerase